MRVKKSNKIWSNHKLYNTKWIIYFLISQSINIGTICSGLFCLCLGIPRFSQHDGVRARIGSFFVNTFVGIAQAFTLIFCLVGWGWSIWWGMIMLRTASKILFYSVIFTTKHLFQFIVFRKTSKTVASIGCRFRRGSNNNITIDI